MSRLLRDSVQSPGSLFKSSAIASIHQHEEMNRSRTQLEQSFNATANQSHQKSLQQTELDNLSTYLRLDHARNLEQTKKVVPRFSNAKIVLSRSLMKDKCHVISDAALFHNRRSRIGWGPDLHHLEFESTTRLTLVTVKTSDIRPHTDQSDDLFTIDSKNPYVVLLATYLSHTKRSLVDGVPMLRPASGSQAISLLKVATENLLSKLKANGNTETLQLLNYMSKVWNLCIALWGPLDVEGGSHAETMARKETLTQWLEEAAMETNINGLSDEEEVLYIILKMEIFKNS